MSLVKKSFGAKLMFDISMELSTLGFILIFRHETSPYLAVKQFWEAHTTGNNLRFPKTFLHLAGLTSKDAYCSRKITSLNNLKASSMTGQ